MKKFLRNICFIIILCSFFQADFATAYTLNSASGNLGKVAGKAGITNESVSGTFGSMIKGSLTAVGLLFFILVFYGGFSWMMASGSEDKIKKAKNTVIAAIIGLIVVLASYAITVLLGGVLDICFQ